MSMLCMYLGAHVFPVCPFHVLGHIWRLQEWHPTCSSLIFLHLYAPLICSHTPLVLQVLELEVFRAEAAARPHTLVAHPQVMLAGGPHSPVSEVEGVLEQRPQKGHTMTNAQ